MNKRLRSRILTTVGMVGTSFFSALVMPASAQDQMTASQRLDRGAQLVEKKDFAEARKVLATIDAAQLKEEERPKLAELLKQTDAAIAMSDKSGAAMDEAKAAADAGNLAVAARTYEGVANDPAASADTKADAKVKLALVREKQKGMADQMKALLTQAVASYDAGNLDESQNALNTIEASGSDLGGDNAKVSKYQKLIAEKRVEMARASGTATTMVAGGMPGMAMPTAPAAPMTPAEPMTPATPAVGGGILGETLAADHVQHDRAVTMFESDMRQSTDAMVQKKYEEALDRAKNAKVTLTTSKQYLSSTEFNTYSDLVEDRIRKAQNAADAYRMDTHKADEKLAADLAMKKQQEQNAERDVQVRRLVAEAKDAYDLQRYEQAEAVLKQAQNIDPLNDLVAFNLQQVHDKLKWQQWQKIHIRRSDETMNLQVSNYEAIIPYNNLMEYPDNWPELTHRRQADEVGTDESAGSRRLRMILDTTIVDETNFNFDNVSLEKFLKDGIGGTFKINVVPDWPSITAAGAEKTSPITIDLHDVSLRAALTKALSQVKLTDDATDSLVFATADGILTVTTKKAQDANPTSQKYVRASYDVRDLIVPAAQAANNGSSNTNNNNNSNSGNNTTTTGSTSISSNNSNNNNNNNNNNNPQQTAAQDQVRQITDLMNLIKSQIAQTTWRYTTLPSTPLIGSSNSSSSSSSQTSQTSQSGQTGTAGGSSTTSTNTDATGEGSIAAVNNALIISQTPENQTEVYNLLQLLREGQSLQVSIECRFLLVDNNFLDDFGLDWQLSFPTGPGTGLRFGSTAGTLGIANNTAEIAQSANTGINGSFPTPGSDANALGAASNALSVGTSFGGVLDSFTASVLIRASQLSKRSTSLSAPRVTMLSGDVASIIVGTNTAYISGFTPITTIANQAGFSSSGGQPIISSFPSGITLNVGAAVTGDRRYVVMSLNPHLDKILLQTPQSFFVGTSSNGVPLVQTISLITSEVQDISTRVNVPDGGTLLIGGTKLLEEREVEAGVPILSKIPIINRAFTNRSYIKDEETLLVLIKPKILIRKEIEEDRFGRSYDAPNQLIQGAPTSVGVSTR